MRKKMVPPATKNRNGTADASAALYFPKAWADKDFVFFFLFLSSDFSSWSQ